MLPDALTMLGLLSAAIWIYLLWGRGGFWRVPLPEPPFAGPSVNARIRVVIPARNEAAGIGQSITSLLTQSHAGPLDIILVDDHSSDGTAEIARTAALACGGAARLTILGARPLPPGWTGKLWAVSEGLAEAARRDADFILLTDADITHHRDNIAELVSRAEAQKLDLVSLMVRLSTASWAERALIPAFIFFFFMLYPPRWAADPKARTAAAAGGCMLIRPAALARIGGIGAIRGALIDDCALAAAIKRSGGRIRLDMSVETVSSRAYESWHEIWAMIARTAFTQLHYSNLALIGTLFGLGITYLAPPLLVLGAHGPAQALGLAAWAGMSLAFLPVIRRYRLNPLWSLTLPAIAVFYAAATFGSAVNYWRGKGGQWKGRSQAIRES